MRAKAELKALIREARKDTLERLHKKAVKAGWNVIDWELELEAERDRLKEQDGDDGRS